MLCLGNGSPSPMLVCISSTLSNPWGTKLHFGLGHAYPSLTSCYTCRPLRHIFHPVIRALDRSSKPSGNGKNENKIMRGVVGASLVLACALGIISASLRMKPKAIAGPREMYQKAPQVVPVAYPLGAKAALESLLDVPANMASSNLEAPAAIFELPLRPSMEEVNAIKMHAVQLMKYGQAEKAVNFLRDAYLSYKYDHEPAYNVEMALVEILICQGKYSEALACNCLDDTQRLPSDARFPLYKAIIHTMLDDKDEAKKWWEEYIPAVEGGFDPRSSRM